MDYIEDESISFVYRSPYLDFLLLFPISCRIILRTLHCMCVRLSFGRYIFDRVETAYDAMNGFFSYSFPYLSFPISLLILVFSTCSPWVACVAKKLAERFCSLRGVKR